MKNSANDNCDLNKTFFSAELLSWYRASKRDLPWRRSRDPYHIWVSEVMLQQTRVETVIPYYHRFLEKFPTVQALAEAPEAEVLKTWEGLGYYSRARNLQQAMREVLEQFGGVVPQEKAEISSLKGVGPYTSGAILSIAYNKPEPAVDGNVMRVLSRYFLLEDDIAKPATRIKIEKLAKELIPEGAAGDFNQGLMELGACVCTPRSPHCLPCPVMAHCSARIEGRVDELPVKTKAKPPRPENRAVALIEGSGEHAGRVLIRQRPSEGLLARMWELPHVELPEALPQAGASPAAERQAESRKRKSLRGDAYAAEAAAAYEAQDGAGHALAMQALEEQLASDDGVSLVPLGWLMSAEHTFSHIQWNLNVYRCQPTADAAGRQIQPMLQPNYCWLAPSEMDKYAFPNVFLRILNQYWSIKLTK